MKQTPMCYNEPKTIKPLVIKDEPVDWSTEDTQDIMKERTDWGDFFSADDLNEAPRNAEDVQEIDTLFRRPDW